MTDSSKTASKFDLQKFIGDVKSMLGPVAIPEASKDDPLGYCLSELSKLVKDMADSHSKQADTIAKISSMLGTLHQEVASIRGNKVPSSSAATSEVKPAAGETKETK
ncbi:MAG: hypothetical protein WCH10_03650 [bacterium]